MKGQILMCKCFRAKSDQSDVKLGKMNDFKIITLGAECVGKTSIVKWFQSNTFEEHYSSNVATDYSTKEIQIDNQQIKLRIYDTAGQERFQNMGTLYFHGADGALIVFDITSKESFERARNCFDLLRANSDQNIKVILIGNKKDLDENRSVSIKEASELGSNENAEYFETSAKSGENIFDAFEFIAKECLKQNVAEQQSTS